MRFTGVLCASLMTAQIATAAETALEKVKLYNSHIGSKQAQEKLNKEVLTLLKSNQLAKIDELFNSIPFCPHRPLTKKEIPARCVREPEWQAKYFLKRVLEDTPMVHVTEVSQQDANMIVNDAHSVNVVVPSKALYYALTKQYMDLFKQDPIQLNKEAYKSFYERYANTVLGTRVEEVMIFVWQDGQQLPNRIETFDGKGLFDAVYTASVLGVKDPYKYVKRDKFWTDYDQVSLMEKMQKVYGQMYARSVETNDTKIFHTIKTLWWNYFLEGKVTSLKEVNRTLWTIKLLSGKYISPRSADDKELAWKTLAISPVTKYQHKQVEMLYNICKEFQENRSEDVLNCDGLKNNAVKYGLMKPSKEEITVQISRALRSLKLNAL